MIIHHPLLKKRNKERIKLTGNEDLNLAHIMQYDASSIPDEKGLEEIMLSQIIDANNTQESISDRPAELGYHLDHLFNNLFLRMAIANTMSKRLKKKDSKNPLISYLDNIGEISLIYSDDRKKFEDENEACNIESTLSTTKLVWGQRHHLL